MSYLGKRVFFVVAQEPFETESRHGRTLTFCTLAPVLDENGEVISPTAFPNAGLAWWMLSPGDRSFAEPGRLVGGHVEEADKFDSHDPSSQKFQATRGDVRIPGDWLDVVRDLDHRVREPRDLVNTAKCARLNHPPTGEVYVNLSGNFYGPFQARDPQRKEDGEYHFSLTTVEAGNRVDVLSPSVAKALGSKGHVQDLEVEVSVTSDSRDRNASTRTCRYELFRSDIIDHIRVTEDIGSIELRSDRSLVNQVAKDFLSRKQRQKLMGLFDEVIDSVGQLDEDGIPDAVDTMNRVKRRLENRESEAEKLARALIDGGFLDSSLEKARERYAEEYVEEQANQLGAQIEQRLKTRKTELREVEAKLEDVETLFEERRQQLDRELEQKRKDFESTLENEMEALEQMREDLEEQQQLVANKLEQLVDRFTNARDEVKGEVIELLPLLEMAQLGRPVLRSGDGHGTPQQAEPPSPREFELPEFIIAGTDTSGATAMSEEAFFELFEDYVQRCGFNYQRDDLAAFHVSVKCEDITVLGGPAGTGKSSLPRLYGSALAGAGSPARFKHVSVRPAWLDMRDLLGHVNSLDRRFEPAETQLYQQLIYAQEEWVEHGEHSGIYLTCMDEMNLSKVEHYFAGFLDALQRPNGQRDINCFSPEAVEETSTFSRWSTLSLPRCVRFVGTVNFDETTQRFSARFLDRVNLIEIAAPRNVIDFVASPLDPSEVPLEHEPTTIGTLDSWRTEGQPLPHHLASVLDALQPHLRALGCALTPRRHRGICTFVASAAPVIPSKEKAFDFQLKLRVIPQIRGLFTDAHHRAVEAILGIFESHEVDLPYAERALSELRDREGRFLQ